MTNFHTELREIIDHTNIKSCSNPYCDHKIYGITEAADTILGIFTHLISEAKPDKYEIERAAFMGATAGSQIGWNNGIDDYEQCLLSIIKGDT